MLPCAPIPGTEILTDRIPVGSQNGDRRGRGDSADGGRDTRGNSQARTGGKKQGGAVMPRWRDLPDELDPQVREFASQLRRLVDRSELSIAAVADRTGYSKTSWERYLNGRLLAPKGAIVALAEVTGTNPIHLTTMWELAERAWSRSEMRHDMTMEAIRISQARAALGEFGAPPANAKGGRTARRSGSATATPGVAGPAGVAPTVPPQPVAPEGDSMSSSGGNSWGVAGYQGPSQASGRTA